MIQKKTKSKMPSKVMAYCEKLRKIEPSIIRTSLMVNGSVPDFNWKDNVIPIFCEMRQLNYGRYWEGEINSLYLKLMFTIMDKKRKELGINEKIELYFIGRDGHYYGMGKILDPYDGKVTDMIAAESKMTAEESDEYNDMYGSE